VITALLTYASNKSLICRQLISLIRSEVIFAVGIGNIPAGYKHQIYGPVTAGVTRIVANPTKIMDRP